MVGKQTAGTPPMNGGNDQTDVGIASMRKANPSTPLTSSKDGCGGGQGDGTDPAASASKESVLATATPHSAMKVKPPYSAPKLGCGWARYTR